jgi:hypothetical protein
MERDEETRRMQNEGWTRRWEGPPELVARLEHPDGPVWLRLPGDPPELITAGDIAGRVYGRVGVLTELPDSAEEITYLPAGLNGWRRA